MNDLMHQQSALLKQIFTLNAGHVNSGVQVYQASLLANACRALEITFATTHSLMGARNFQQLVKGFISQYGKAEFDWGEYGKQLPAYISQQSHPHQQLLADIAHLDLACHQAERSADIETDLASIALLAQEDAYQLTIEFASGFQLLTTEYAIDEIISDIEQMIKEANHIGLQQVAQQLNNYQPTRCHFLIWRVGYQAKYQRLSFEDFTWLQQWQNKDQGMQISSIGTALDNTQTLLQQTKKCSFSFEDWLPQAISTQLIASIKLIHNTQ